MIFPVPKPRNVRKAKPKGLRRSRIRARNPKRKGSAFPKQRDPAYRAWVRGLGCLLWDKLLQRAISLHDTPFTLGWRGFVHRCWGPIDPAHVGPHQANGAPDLGACVPLCRAAHDYYDQHRSAFAKVTGWSEKLLANHAAGLALRYVERGGVVTPRKEPQP